MLSDLPGFGGGDGKTAVAAAFNTALAPVECPDCLGVLAPAGAALTPPGMADTDLELDDPALTVLGDVGGGVDGGVGLRMMARRHFV